jgi:1-deoxyxylulose-5-phosphate synthase
MTSRRKCSRRRRPLWLSTFYVNCGRPYAVTTLIRVGRESVIGRERRSAQYVTMDRLPLPVSRVVLGSEWCDARRLLRVGRRQLRLPGVDRGREGHLFDVLYDDVETDVGPIVEVLNHHVQRGHICQLGVSNWSPEGIAAAQTASADKGLRGFAVSSVQLSLASGQSPPWRNARSISGVEGADERRWYRTQPLWVLAYSSLAMGFFSSRRMLESGDAGHGRLLTLARRMFDSAVNSERRARAALLAKEIGVSVGQVALAWVLHELLRVLAIVGARRPSAIRDAAGACAIALSEAQGAWLSSGVPVPQTPGGPS